MALFHQQIITDPFCFLLFDLDNHSYFYFHDITSLWCCSTITTGSYLDFFISSHLDLLSSSSLWLSIFSWCFFIMMVIKSRECLDYKKFVLEILESHLAFSSSPHLNCPLFLLSSSISSSSSSLLCIVNLSPSFVNSPQLCPSLPALFHLSLNHSMVSNHRLTPSMTMDYHRITNNHFGFLL